MAVYRQWWSQDKSFQITTMASVSGVAPGTTVGPVVVWLFNDKGGVHGGTATMAAYRLIAEASWDGVNWVRSGPEILNQAWIEAAITGIDNTGSPGMPAQATGYTKLGAGRSLLLSDIPKNCGRQVTYQVVVPLGGANAGLHWRLVAEVSSNTLSAADLANGATGTPGTPIVLRDAPTINTPAVTGGTWSTPTVTGGGTYDGTQQITGAIKQPGIGAPVMDGATWFYTQAGVGAIWRAGGGIFLRTGASDVNRIVLDTAGNVGLCTVMSAGGGQRVLYLENRAAAPGSNPANGHLVYAESGALKGRGSSGTVTTIAAAEPHCPQCKRDVGVIEAVNHDGGYFFVCLPCLVLDLDLSGKPYVVIDVDDELKPALREGEELEDAIVVAKGVARAARLSAKVDAEVPKGDVEEGEGKG